MKLFITGTPYSGIHILENILKESGISFENKIPKIKRFWDIYKKNKIPNLSKDIYLSENLLEILPSIRSTYPESFSIVLTRSPFFLFKYISEIDPSMNIEDFIEHKSLEKSYDALSNLVWKDTDKKTVFFQIENIINDPQVFFNFFKKIMKEKLNVEIKIDEGKILKEIQTLKIKSTKIQGGATVMEPLIYSKIKRKWWWIYHIFYKNL